MSSGSFRRSSPVWVQLRPSSVSYAPSSLTTSMTCSSARSATRPIRRLRVWPKCLTRSKSWPMLTPWKTWAFKDLFYRYLVFVFFVNYPKRNFLLFFRKSIGMHIPIKNSTAFFFFLSSSCSPSLSLVDPFIRLIVQTAFAYRSSVQKPGLIVFSSELHRGWSFFFLFPSLLLHSPESADKGHLPYIIIGAEIVFDPGWPGISS